MKSLKELYKTGRGPSSSHTMGPDKACRYFKTVAEGADFFEVTLFGSLAATGKGHLTDTAIKEALAPVKTEVAFDCSVKDLPHPNTMILKAYRGGEKIAEKTVLSVGGGAIKVVGEPEVEPPEVYPHKTFSEIKDFCKESGLRLWEYVETFEGEEIWDYLSEKWEDMLSCVADGLKAEGTLPGGLGTKRKAKTLYDQYVLNEDDGATENRLVRAYAFAASEQNASGGKIVTAPTCGSCGVIPAVMKYLKDKRSFSDEKILKALATAGVIGNAVKENASISGAECGCQAEVGVACAMASAGIAELYDMSLDQIEYAAEISVEHHLGLTCDPVCGLVQIPCIERNAVAALRALNEFTLAKFLTDSRKISLDTAIKTMYETGKDLRSGYRETSEKGLARVFGGDK